MPPPLRLQEPATRHDGSLRRHLMSDRIRGLLHRNLQEVFGEGDAARRRAAIDELHTDDCVLYVPPGVFVGRDALDKFAGARPLLVCHRHQCGARDGWQPGSEPAAWGVRPCAPSLHVRDRPDTLLMPQVALSEPVRQIRVCSRSREGCAAAGFDRSNLWRSRCRDQRHRSRRGGDRRESAEDRAGCYFAAHR